MVFHPKTSPLVWRLLGEAHSLDQSSLEEGVRPDSRNLRKPPDHSGGSRSCIKYHPLTHTSSDVTDAEPITPSHLLYGRPMKSLPHRDVQDNEIDDPTYGEASDIERRTKIQSQLLHHFWNRWSKEYLTALHEFHRVSGNNTQMVRRRYTDGKEHSSNSIW